jgi:hypothetical protein
METVMKMCCKGSSLIILVFFFACQTDESDSAAFLISSNDFDFSKGTHGWEPGFADYPAGPDDSTLYELEYAYTDDVPESILSKKSFMLSGSNRNQDLFMYLKKKISGLKPETEYTVTFTVELASNLDPLISASGSIYLKAGATRREPKSVIDAGNYVLNIDKGDDGAPGADVITLGDIAAPTSSLGYAVMTRNNTMTNSRYVARTDVNGDLWLIVGTDSNMEGTIKIFYTRINVVLSAS